MTAINDYLLYGSTDGLLFSMYQLLKKRNFQVAQSPMLRFKTVNFVLLKAQNSKKAILQINKLNKYMKWRKAIHSVTSDAKMYECLLLILVYNIWQKSKTS